MSTQQGALLLSQKQQFLDAYEREHQITMKVLRAYPVDQLDLQPHPKCKTARELAFIFVLERYLGVTIMNDAFASLMAAKSPEPPADWDNLLGQLEDAHNQFAHVVGSLSDAALQEEVTFLVGPKTPGKVQRIAFAWFLLHDQIHHRGQFSVYLRMAGAKVPSIYGPTADEPWF